MKGSASCDADARGQRGALPFEGLGEEELNVPTGVGRTVTMARFHFCEPVLREAEGFLMRIRQLRSSSSLIWSGGLWCVVRVVEHR